jgi:hypothetical protein
MADILEAATNTLAAGRKYEEVLSIFGLNDDFFSRFEATFNDAKAVPTERENRVLLSNTTDSKDDILAECYQWGKYLNLRLRNAFGYGSREHQKFPSDTFYAASESERTMMPVMEQILTLAKSYRDELLDHGQTDETIAEGEALLTALDEADDVQELKKLTKQGDTEERRQLFSELVDFINRTNRTGRSVAEQNNDPVMFAYFKSPWPRARSTAEPAEDEV